MIAGRAFAYAGLKLPALYVSGNAARKNPELMTMLISHGMAPVNSGSRSLMDSSDIARGFGKEGGWGDPNESWVGLGSKYLGNKLHSGLGDSFKSGLDKVGEFWHGTLLWDRVADLQAGIGQDSYLKNIKKGMDQNAAATVAAHVANRGSR